MADSAKGSYGGTAALEGFEALVKSSSGSACVEVIKQVLKHQQIFVFGELLEAPNIKDLASFQSGQFKPWLELLRVFAYGTYADYKAKPDLPKLGPKELTKLRQLSIVEYAAKNQVLSYRSLMADLDIGNVRELEDLIIDCVYMGLIQGKLDQRKHAFEVQSVIGRDLGPTEVADMTQLLANWMTGSEALLKNLEKKIEFANLTYEKKKKDTAELEKVKKDTIESLKAGIQSGDQEALALAYGEGGRGERGQRSGALDERGGGGPGARRRDRGSGGASGLPKKFNAKGRPS